MAKQERIRVGIIGAGRIANAHLTGYLSHPLAEVRGIADVNIEKAKQIKERHGLKEATLFLDYHELIADNNIDAVSICTPPHLHGVQAISASRLGKHVLCEKPLAMNSNEARQMHETAKHAGVVNMVGFVFQFIPAIQYAKKLIADGVIGQIRRVRAEYVKDLMARTISPDDWTFIRAKAGSGPIGAVGSHVFHLGRFLAGEMSSLYAMTRKFTPIGDTEEHASIVVDFAKGAVGIVEVSYIATGRSDYHRVEVNGDKGAFVFEYDKPGELQVFSNDGVLGDFGRFLSVPVPGCPHLSDAFSGHRYAFINEVAHFLDCIAEGKQACPSFLDGLRCQEIIDAALESGTSGLRVTIPQ